MPLRRLALLSIAAALCGLVAPVALARTSKGNGKGRTAAVGVAWTWSTRLAASGRYDVAIKLKKHAGHKPGQDVLQVTGPDGRSRALDAAVLPRQTATFTLAVATKKLTLRFAVRKGKPAVATTRVAAIKAPAAAPAVATPAPSAPAPSAPATPTTTTPAPHTTTTATAPAITVTPAPSASTPTTPAARKLLFDDEFDGAAGALGADSAWDPQTGPGWGSGQLQNYTDRTQNVELDGSGNLAIVARHESYQGSSYTSARLQTKGRFSFTYGRAEARIKVPAGAGIWPAFWLLGDDIYAKGWPEAGEIDVMETIGSLPDELNGTVHAPLGAWSGDANADGAEWTIGDIYKNGASLADAFHVYAVDWTPDSIAFEIDGRTYQTVAKADMPAGGRWTFDHPNHLLLNLAVGGDWPGAPNASTPSVSTMLVDYVRVYAPRS